MIIMALDPALRNTGVTVFNTILNDLLMYDDLIVTAKSKDKKIKVATDLDNNAEYIARELNKVIETYTPDLIVIETSASAGKDARAARSLGIIKGIVWGVAVSNGIPVQTYSEREIKLAMTNNPKASKRDLMDVAVEAYPQLHCKKWLHQGRLKNDFEHVADSVCAYLTYIKNNTKE